MPVVTEPWPLASRQVDNGSVVLANRTVFLGNVAPSGHGNSISFSAGSLSYHLPAPLARWLLVPSGTATNSNNYFVD